MSILRRMAVKMMCKNLGLDNVKLNIITNDRNIHLTGDPTEWARKMVEFHDLIRSRLLKNKEVYVYCKDTENAVIIKQDGDQIVAAEYIEHAEAHFGEDDIIIDKGFCHTGNALELTNDLGNPLKLTGQNYMFATKAKRCGCIFCGRIFEGEDIMKNLVEEKEDDFDRMGTAICTCRMNTIIVEEPDEGIFVNENNLWRWNKIVFGDKTESLC